VRNAKVREFFTAGADDRPTGLKTSHPVKPNTGGVSPTGAAIERAKYNEHTFIGETVADHVVPRKSITDSQYLRLFPQTVEVEPIKTRQLDKATGKMVETTDNRVVWRSDRTLLDTTRPDSKLAGKFKREGEIRQGANVRKYRATVPNEEPMVEIVLGPALDDDE